MGFIPEETIDRVLQSTDIVELIGGYFPLKRVGSNFVALCPFHDERSPSFHVSPTRQSYHCFGCGAGGSSIRFVMEYEQLDFPTAVRRLAESAGIEITETTPDPKADKKKQLRRELIDLHKAATLFFQKQLLDSSAAQSARDYLTHRGMTAQTIADWQIGYAPGGNDFFDWAKKNSYSEKLLISAGLAATDEESGRTYSRFRQRIVFPIHNEFGEVIAYSARSLDPEARAKYLNSPETEIFVKNKVLFGLHRAKRAIARAENALICEGQIDVIACAANGIEHAIAPLGTAFSPAHAAALRRLTSRVTLCFDADSAGTKAARSAFVTLAEHDLQVLALGLPTGSDPDSLINEHGAEAFRDRLQNSSDFFTYLLDRALADNPAPTPHQTLEISRDIASLIPYVREPILRDSTVTTAAARLGIDPADIYRLAKKNNTQNYANRNSHKQKQTETTSQTHVEPTPSNRLYDQLIPLIIDHAAAFEMAAIESQDQPIIDDPSAEFLRRIIAATPEINEPPTVSKLLHSLTAPDAARLTKLLQSQPKVTEDTAKKMAVDILGKIRSEALDHHRKTLINQMRQPNLSSEELSKLQQELIQLTKTDEKTDKN